MQERNNLNRRQFLATSMAGAAALKTSGTVSASGHGYEALLPAGSGRILAALDGGHLLTLMNDNSASLSRDGGETWGEPFPLLQQGKPMNVARNHLVPLKGGTVGMVYAEELSGAPARHADHRVLRFASSRDGGRNWSAGSDIDLPGPGSGSSGAFLQVPFGRLTELSTGRLLLPVYWQFNGLHPETRRAMATGMLDGYRIGLEGHAHRPQMSGCFAYFSDDRGSTWQRSTGSIMVWPLPGERSLGGFGGTAEPVVTELKDGSVLMLLRTKVGRFFQTHSEDGGENWHEASPTALSSGDVPCDLDRLRDSGQLLVIWNQTSGDEIRNGYYRSRLSVATSADEGQTWRNFKTVDSSPGLEPAGRISPPPVAHIRVNPDAGKLPSGFFRCHYPSLAFSGDQVLMTYQYDTVEKGKRTRRIKLVRVPESWFQSA